MRVSLVKQRPRLPVLRTGVADGTGGLVDEDVRIEELLDDDALDDDEADIREELLEDEARDEVEEIADEGLLVVEYPTGGA